MAFIPSRNCCKKNKYSLCSPRGSCCPVGALLSLVPLSGACAGCANEEWGSGGAPGRGATPRLHREGPGDAPGFGWSLFPAPWGWRGRAQVGLVNSGTQSEHLFRWLLTSHHLWGDTVRVGGGGVKGGGFWILPSGSLCGAMPPLIYFNWFIATLAASLLGTADQQVASLLTAKRW